MMRALAVALCRAAIDAARAAAQTAPIVLTPRRRAQRAPTPAASGPIIDLSRVTAVDTAAGSDRNPPLPQLGSAYPGARRSTAFRPNRRATPTAGDAAPDAPTPTRR